MAASGKWIKGLTGGDPVTEMARIVLDSRLGDVADSLDDAATADRDDEKPVHALRVSSRRAVAAMETFREYLPPRKSKHLLIWLKKVRRAAGNARDLDVLTERLRAAPPEKESKAWEHRLEQLEEDRRRERTPIRRVAAKLEDKHFRRMIKSLSRKLDDAKSEAPSFANVARQRLGQVVSGVFEQTWNTETKFEALHKLRIDVKELRYSLEIFGGILGPKVRECYSEIEQLQTRLGELNDHVTAEAYWLDLCEDADSHEEKLLRNLIERERRKAQDARRRLFAEWPNTRWLSLKANLSQMLSVAA